MRFQETDIESLLAKRGKTSAEINTILGRGKDSPARKKVLSMEEEILKKSKGEPKKKKSESNETESEKPNARNKYGNHKVEADGLSFDSKLEYKFYLKLKDLKESDKIKDFFLQPEYLLLEGYRDQYGNAIQPITYIGDFKVIMNNDMEVVVDTKGMQTEAFRLKGKMFEQKYPELIFLLPGVGKNTHKARKKDYILAQFLFSKGLTCLDMNDLDLIRECTDYLLITHEKEDIKRKHITKLRKIAKGSNHFEEESDT